MSSFPESSTSTTGAETTTTTSSNTEPQPGTSQDPIINTDDPKPGPSTTAADFDLEVFDSGSSCSLEDCWGCPDIQTTPKQQSIPLTVGGKSVKKTSKQLDLSVEEEDNSENEFDDLHVSTMSASPFNAEPMESACPSETEEAISDDEDEDEDKMDDDDGDQDHCQCPKSLIALPPLRLSEAVNSNTSTSSGSTSSTSTSLLKSSCWKCAGPSTSTASLTLCTLHASSESTENIDEIVQDHDNFGTDENEDDSSLDSTSSCLGMSLLVKDTPPEELMAIPANKIGGFKRKSNEDQSVNTSGFIDHSITAKKKRETFISEEQEVCLTPIGKPSKKNYFKEKKRDISYASIIRI